MPTIFESLLKIKARPLLYLKDCDLGELHVFLNGYYLAMTEFEVQDELGIKNFMSEFGRYLRTRFGWSMSAGPFFAINEQFGDSGWDRAFELIEDFRAACG